MLLLRSLNPKTEQALFREAYLWRSNRRSRLQPDRMSFEDFAKDDPSQIVLGLFNGELQAVYLFSQIGPTEFEAHFTSSRKAARGDVLAGASQLVQWFGENGLTIIGRAHKGNVPLRHFLEDAGLVAQDNPSNRPPPENTGQITAHSDTVPCNHKTFVEYRSQVTRHKAFG